MGPAVREVVRRRQAQRLARTASTGTSRPASGDKVAYHWIGEPGDTRTITYADLLREVQKTANALKELGVAHGRPGRDLHAHDPRAAHRHARLRAPRRAAHGRLRRLLRGGAVRPHQRRPGQGAHHRRRRLAAGQGRSTSRRPRTRRCSETPTIEHVLVVRRVGDAAAHDHDRGPRRLVARHRGAPDAPTARPCPSTPSTCCTCCTPRGPRPSPRASCTPRPATSWAPAYTHADGLRHQARRRLLVRRGHRLGHGPQLHRLRAAGQRARTGVIYEGAPDTPGLGSLVADRRGVQGHHPVHRADRHPRLHEAGRGAARAARPVVAAPARLRGRAHQPRGLAVVPASTSAASAARSSTPGGRPRRA